MANIEVVTVPPVVPPVVPVRKFILSLSEDEARTLRDILGRVGGDPNYSRRKHKQVIFNALYDELGWDDPPDLIGTLLFKDDK